MSKDLHTEPEDLTIKYTHDTYEYSGSREYTGGPAIEPDEEVDCNLEIHNIEIMGVNFTDYFDGLTTYEDEEELWYAVKDMLVECKDMLKKAGKL